MIVLSFNKIKSNRNSQILLLSGALVLIFDSIIENLICGTDGLRLPCSSNLIMGISLLYNLTFLFILALFLRLSSTIK